MEILKIRIVCDRIFGGYGIIMAEARNSYSWNG